MSTPFIFNDISAISAAIPTLIGGITWKRQPIALQLLVVFTGISLGTDLVGSLLITIYGTNSALMNAYLAVQSVMVGLYFLNLREISQYNRLMVRITFWIMCIVTIILLFNGPFFEGFHKWHLVTSSLFIIFFCFFYFFNLVRYELMVPLWYKPSFFAVSGLMMYHASNTCLFLTVDFFHPEVVLELWYFKLVGYIFLNALFSVALIIELKDIPGGRINHHFH